MISILQPNDIAGCINALIARNKLWAHKKVQVYYISNKTAGCFTKKKKSIHYKALFNAAQREAERSPECVGELSYKIFSTEYAGHAKELTQAVVAEFIAMNEPNSECVIVIAGGDGTSLEVQTALYKEAQTVEKKRQVIKDKIAIIRLPLGTGNDGTDGHKLDETIKMLNGPLTFTNSRAIKVCPEKNPTEEQIKACKKNPLKYNPDNPPAPWYAFNIASIGVDAYVVYMTNTIKKKFPGNLYQLCVPLSGIVYDKDFPTGTGTFEFFDENGNKFDEHTCPITLFAFGVSGHRVYGGGHKIFPTDDNANLVRKISLARLIKDNSKFIDGSFLKTDLSLMYSADKVRISYDKPILVQCDGEPVMLCKDHFPLIMEKTEPCLRVLKSLEE